MANTGSNMCSENPDVYCEIEATVPTGFEPATKQEIQDKLGVSSVVERGHALFKIPVKDALKCLELQSVDNLYVVVKHFEHIEYPDDKDGSLQVIGELVPKMDYTVPLNVWKQFIHFDHEVSPLPCKNWLDQHAAETPCGNIKGGELELSDSENVVAKKPKCSEIDNMDGPSVKNDSTVNTNSIESSVSTQDAPPAKQPWIDSLPAFRATCYRTGSNHAFQSQQAAHHFGGILQDYFGWNVSMKQFDIEVVLNITGPKAYVTVGLTKQSRHKRHISHFGPTTLRPTICFSMLYICQIQPGDVVCDPMCGGGSLPIEAAINWPQSVHICGDIHDKAYNRAKMNIDCLNNKYEIKGKPKIDIQVFQWNTCSLPLQDNYVDVFVTDLPFGRRSGSKADNRKLYPDVLRELARVSKRSTGRACILTQDKRTIQRALDGMQKLWKRRSTFWVNIGGLAAGVYLIQRTKNVYSAGKDNRKGEDDSNKLEEDNSGGENDNKTNSTKDEEKVTENTIN
ncbi:unnamed protein product [Owenia fusiformis]|uniref:Ribosomal RNA large subunit methyltransferase K/L-like methyltransferase domain-containing protein n=1 Tax=Owenia fusiformis TaxID=6347 RepID=A0A8J1TVK9_OWEFU|nr:unnamed protein product [Owenia fusiformis]